MNRIHQELGIRATCGIGTNLYLTKVALDILAKHDSEFIGELDEKSYQTQLWDHKPLTDFWRIGRKTAKKLQNIGIDTMGKLAHTDESYLYSRFGIDAELLIDHAWGREPVTIQDIRKYHPKSNSLSSGQVLMRDYSFQEGRLILKEMIDQLCLKMSAQNLKTDSITIYVGYTNQASLLPVRGTASLSIPTNLSTQWIPEALKIYDRIVSSSVPVRRFNISCNRVQEDGVGDYLGSCLDFLSSDEHDTEKDEGIQQVMLDVRKRFGKNAVFRGMDLMEEATTLERNCQIGGHKSGTKER